MSLFFLLSPRLGGDQIGTGIGGGIGGWIGSGRETSETKRIRKELRKNFKGLPPPTVPGTPVSAIYEDEDDLILWFLGDL